MSTSFGWEGKGRYGSFRQRMNAGCAGKTVRSIENACHIPERLKFYRKLEKVSSRRGAIQIHVYLYLYLTAPQYLSELGRRCDDTRLRSREGN